MSDGFDNHHFARWKPSALPPLRLSAVADVPFMEKPRALPPPRPVHPVRSMSPRALAELAYELYLAGRLDREGYLLLGFPSEVNPAYDRTVGALTGEHARPDVPRDLILTEERRLAMLRASAACLPELIVRSEKILALLRWLEHPGA